MNSYEINDKRLIKEFAGISFSGFKKNDAKKQLTKNIVDGRVEEANYWAAELICSANFLDLWEIFSLRCKE